MSLPPGLVPSQGDWPFVAGFALLLCLLVASVGAVVRRGVETVPVQLQPLPDARGIPSRVSGDRASLLLPAGRGRETAARLHVRLPTDDEAGSRWTVWVGRTAVDALALTVPGGSGPTTRADFFAPATADGVLPSGFLFPLPAGLAGDTMVELRASGTSGGALRVKVLREGDALRLEQAGAAMSAAIYAALFTLALSSLALFGAARDRIYLLSFGTTTSALLLVSAQNGHLYQLPLFGAASLWRAQGIWALGLLCIALALQLLLRYVDAHRAHPGPVRWIDRGCILLCALAAVCLLRLSLLDALLPLVGGPVLVVAAVAGLLLLVDGARRGVQMAWPVALLVLLGLVATTFATLARGRWVDPVWLRYGCQMVLVATMAVLAVGLVGRISEYRSQRDRDRLARVDSERRMRREAARADLNTALQSQLRTLAAGDVEWSAFRLLLDHLVPQVPVEFATTLAYGFHGQDIVVVVPQARKQVVDDIVARRLLPLKRHAAYGVPLQQPVTVPAQHSVVAMEAVVPLPIRAPAWGVLLLHRSGGEGFSTEELALAGEFARLALLNVEQALAAINLRRSAELDALTGTFNRRTIDQWLTRSFTEADRDGYPVSVLFVDMDHFKAINDRNGHACGDHCLREVATTLRGALAEGDLLGRYGGEEFIAVLPGRGGAAGRVVGEQLRAAVERLRITWEGEVLPLTVSVGVATRLPHDGSAPDAVARADKALYSAKREGRNRVHVAPAMFS